MNSKINSLRFRMILMTVYEEIISKINKRLDDDLIRQDVSKVLMSPNTTEKEIIDFFSNFWTARFVDFNLLKRCVALYAKDKRILRLYISIADWALSLHNDNPKELESYAFELVISDNGYERFMGRHLWDEFNMNNSDIDILSFTKEEQIRFTFSIVQDFMFPQKRIKKLLNLFNSPYEDVRKLLVNNILWKYTLNYFGSVKKAFSEQIFTESEELKLFQTFLESFEKLFILKQDCKELHSEYSFPEEYDICLHEATEHLRKNTEKVTEESKPSFWKLVQTVELGRGGGWRKEDGTVIPLNRISYSQEIPMMIHAFTPLEEKEYTEIMFKNWSNQDKNDEAQNS